MQSNMGLAEKLQKLENERSNLRKEVENLKSLAQFKAASLEQEINELKESVDTLRNMLSDDQPDLATAAPKGEAAKQVMKTPPASRMISEPREKLTIPHPSQPENQKVAANAAQQEELYYPPANDYSVLQKFEGDERKVVEVLVNHGGECSQKFVREAANLSWLQSNKVFSRLAERGVIASKKKDGLEYLVLVGQLK